MEEIIELDYKEKTIKSEKLYEGRIITLRLDTIEMPNQKYSKREIIAHPGAVVILPVLPDGRIVLIHNYRTAVQRTLMELPAGMIEYQEEPIETAKRELLEETGCQTDNMTFLFDAYSTPGFTDEKWQFFLAKDIEKVSDEIDPEIKGSTILTMDELLEQIDNCRLMDSKTIMATLFLKRHWDQYFPAPLEGE